MPEKEMIGVRITEETKERIEDQLEYGDSVSGWVRDAIELKFETQENMEGNCQNQMEISVVS